MTNQIPDNFIRTLGDHMIKLYPTWTCHVCGDERPDSAISVFTSTVTVNGVPITQNVRFCNDREDCIQKAPTIKFFRPDENQK
jgi:hypothetical protein